MTLPSNATSDATVGEFPREITRQQQPCTTPKTVERARTLDDLEAQFTAIAAHFQSLVDSAGAEMCIRPPAPGSWSVAGCLQHLNMSVDVYFPVWQQVIAAAGPRKTELNAPYSTDFWGRLLSWIQEPPSRIQSKTPLPFESGDCNEVTPVLDGFLDRQQRIISALYRCRGRAIDKVKMASPIDRRIRYSIWSSFIINAAHERRHLWQAQQAIDKLRSTS
jgi:hypothetical protein